MKKKGSFAWFPNSLPELWSLSYLKKVYFLQFFADLSKKSKSIKTIYNNLHNLLKIVKIYFDVVPPLFHSGL